jgi:hypothetical protein
VWYEEEVQTFIRDVLAPQLTAGTYQGMTLVFVEDDTPIGVSAHYSRLYASMSDGDGITASYIEAMAIATGHQGSIQPDGTSLSTTILNATVRDCLRVTGRERAVVGLVAEENRRMRAVLSRLGFQEDLVLELRPSLLGGLKPYLWVDQRF